MYDQTEAKDHPLIDIMLPPPQKWQLRVIIWKADNVVCKDEVRKNLLLFV